jgi:small subunit ribosomal protein S20
MMKTVVKKVEVAVSENNAETAQQQLPDALRILDKSVSKGIIHKNKAARKKSNLTRKVNGLSAGA